MHTQVQFDNGTVLEAEYMDGNGGVMIVPVDDRGRILFIREYAVAVDGYPLGLPKGKLMEGEDPAKCAMKELREELGVKAGRLEKLADLHVSPSYSKRHNHVFLARDLSEGKLQSGDEPEDVEVVPLTMEEAEEKIHSGELTEARAIA